MTTNDLPIIYGSRMCGKEGGVLISPSATFDTLKALANEDTLLPTQIFARLPARATFVGHKFCVRDTKNVSDFVQKHFVSATNVSQFAQPKKHHKQQCVRNNVSSFARAFRNVSRPCPLCLI